MPKVYGYTRASTGSQSLTFDVQQAAIKRYFKEKLEPIGYEWGDRFESGAPGRMRPAAAAWARAECRSEAAGLPRAAGGPSDKRL
jgi:hypothetical protein